MNMCAEIQLFLLFLFLLRASSCANTHTLSLFFSLIDCCTAESIGDFIDESLKSSLKQNKLFTSQLESNGVLTVVTPFSDDK